MTTKMQASTFSRPSSLKRHFIDDEQEAGSTSNDNILDDLDSMLDEDNPVPDDLLDGLNKQTKSSASDLEDLIPGFDDMDVPLPPPSAENKAAEFEQEGDNIDTKIPVTDEDEIYPNTLDKDNATNLFNPEEMAGPDDDIAPNPESENATEGGVLARGGASKTKSFKDLNVVNDTNSVSPEMRQALEKTKDKDSLARRKMNLMNTLGMVMKSAAAVVDTEDAKIVTKDIIKRSEKLKLMLYKDFGAEDESQIPEWLKAQLTYYCVSMVAESPTLSVDDLYDISSTIMTYVPDFRNEYNPSADDNLSFKMTFINSMVKIERALDDYIQHLNTENIHTIAKRMADAKPELMSELSDFISDRVNSGIVQLAPSDEMPNKRHCIMLAQNLTKNITTVLLDVMNNEIIHFWDKLSENTEKNRRDAFLENYAERNEEGIAKSKIMNDTSQAFKQVFSLTKDKVDTFTNRLIQAVNISSEQQNKM